MVGGRGVRLADDSAVLEAPLFLCVDLDAGRSGALSEVLVRKASAVEPEWLPVNRYHLDLFAIFNGKAKKAYV